MCFNPRPHARGDTRHLRLTPSLSSFNPRPHARGDVKSDQFTRLDLVSIHAPTRGATFFSTSYIKRRMFQSTPPREGRPSSTLAASRQHCFNPRPHREGRHFSRPRISSVGCFNPRPHARGDQARRWRHHGSTVSIHAPTARGDVGHEPLHTAVQMVSIHAPTRGATKIRLRAALRLVVSIHAPARGATEREVLFLTSGKFQSTPPRGGRPNSLQRVCALTWCFNPRPHAGGDYSALGSMSDNGVSIHAPTRGATPRLFLGTSFDVFQSTPPRGGRPADMVTSYA